MIFWSNLDPFAGSFSCVIWPDSERTIADTETNNTSYESFNNQLIGAERTGVWSHHEGATPTSGKYSTFWGKVGVVPP